MIIVLETWISVLTPILDLNPLNLTRIIEWTWKFIWFASFYIYCSVKIKLIFVWKMDSKLETFKHKPILILKGQGV